jgi:uncharacterized alpha-E superfamily protein
MLSRVADSTYWMSRYLERAEHTTRLLDVNLNLALEESSTSADRRWQRMIAALGNPRGVKWTGDAAELTHALTFDTEVGSSILSCILAARENARHVREQISTEQWQRLNRLYLQVTRTEAQYRHGEFDSEQLGDFLQSITEAVQQFQGVTDSTMSHGEGWQFIQVGRYMERASATVMLLEVYHHDLWARRGRATEGNEYLEWIGLLRCATAFEAYCKVYTADFTPERILEFLLLDAEFPHSVRFSIDALQHGLEAIHGDVGKRRAEPLSRLAGRVQASLSYANVDEILAQDVIAYLHSILVQCREIHQMLYQLYINYSIQAALAG